MRVPGTFEAVLEKYGQGVSIHYGEDPAGVPCRAFVQPLLEERGGSRQALPTPLGIVCPDRWIYLGDPGIPLDGLENGYVQWLGKRFDVLRAQPVFVGDALSHWWAVLVLRDEEGNP